MPDQQRNVLAALAQRGDPQTQHIQPKIQIAAETALHHPLLQIAIGGGQNTNVDGNAAGATDRTNLLLLDRAQHFRLQVDGKLSDFVEENSSPSAMDISPSLETLAPVNAPFT